MSEARIIKRYANRKLYDTQHSRYVTLEQISEMIRRGDDVTIIDNKSKEDLTSVTLAQIIFEEEKKQKSFLPLQAMRHIIQTGGESITQLVTQAQKKVTNILPRKGKDDEGDPGEDVHPAAGDASAFDPGELTVLSSGPEVGAAVGDDDGAARRSGVGLSSWREFREWIVSSQRTIDEWQRKVDGRVRHMVEGISLSPFASLHKDVKGLASRIAELEAKLDELVASEEAAADRADGANSRADTFNPELSDAESSSA